MSRSPLIREVVLAELPSGHGQRLLVVHCTRTDGGGPTASSLELRQQSWGDGVGWFTQSSVALTPEQVGELRTVLGQTPAGKRLVASGMRTEGNVPASGPGAPSGRKLRLLA